MVNEELLDATREQVNVAEAFLSEYLGYRRSLPLVVTEHNHRLVGQILEAE